MNFGAAATATRLLMAGVAIIVIGLVAIYVVVSAIERLSRSPDPQPAALAIRTVVLALALAVAIVIVAFGWLAAASNEPMDPQEGPSQLETDIGK